MTAETLGREGWRRCALGAMRLCRPQGPKDAGSKRRARRGGWGTAWAGSRVPERMTAPSSDIVGHAMRRYLIGGLLGTAWCCAWIMVGLIIGMP